MDLDLLVQWLRDILQGVSRVKSSSLQLQAKQPILSSLQCLTSTYSTTNTSTQLDPCVQELLSPQLSSQNLPETCLLVDRKLSSQYQTPLPSQEKSVTGKMAQEDLLQSVQKRVIRSQQLTSTTQLSLT